MRETRPVWEIVGMDQTTYCRLPWPKKRVLITRTYGLVISDTCAICGHRLDVMAERHHKETLPPELQEHPFGLLLDAYFSQSAEDFAIHSKYPQAVLSCDDQKEELI